METNLSRRNFLLGVGAFGAAAGLGLAGCAPKSAAEAETEGNLATTGEAGQGGHMPASWDEECDVLVLGAGGAGCAGALTAARDGAKVIVVESQATTGTSSTAICKGNFAVIGSDEQKALGIEDSSDQYVEDCLAWGNSDGFPGGPANNEDMIRTFADNSAECQQVLKELGLEFPDPYVATGNSVARVHVVDNAQMQQLLEQGAKEAGAEFMFNTEFTRLAYDGNGTVMGAFVQDGSKERAIKANKGVLLTTGGFCRNVELVEECLPGLSEVEARTAAGATGMGHLAAMELGGAMFGRNWLYVTEGWSPDGSAWCEMTSCGAIVTDREGNRFIDDGASWSNTRTRALMAKGKHPEYDCYFNWYICDQKVYDLGVEAGDPMGVYDKTEPLFIKADTIEELAAAIDAPNLPATLAKYNENIASGNDEFGRKYLDGAGTGDPFPLTQPPYYAWASKPVLEYSPVTGFVMNGDCQILDQYGEPIGGGRLFSAGEIVLRSIVGNHFMIGSGIGTCTTLGMVIGHKAAALDAIA